MLDIQSPDLQSCKPGLLGYLSSNRLYSRKFFVPLHPKHQEQSSSDGLANRASSESRAKPVWALPSRERGRALAQPSNWSHGGQYDAGVTFTNFKTFQIMQQHIYYIKYALQFADMQIPELVNMFNQQVQSRAWTSMRAYHDKALLDEFQRRGINTSAVSDGKAISFVHPVRYDLSTISLIIIA